MVNLLNQHTQTVHGGGQASAPQTSKLEKLPRPTFTLNMTESQWSFTKIQWDNYIKQSAVSESVKLMQLQASCDDALRQRVFTNRSTFLDKNEGTLSDSRAQVNPPNESVENASRI